MAAVGSEKDKQSAVHYTTALHINSPVFSHHICMYSNVCRKRRLKGGLEWKLMLKLCLEIVHINLYNYIS